jgi:hypothetical protein
MSGHLPTKAEGTVTMLQEAVHNGLPVLIPGAFEKREGRSMAQPAVRVTESVMPHARSAAVYDRPRLEHERAGGGAPRERRTARRHGTFLDRLWHCVLHPGDLPIIWRRPLPQQRFGES